MVLAMPVSAQIPEGIIRVHVTVPGTQVPIPGVQLSLVDSTALLDLPDKERDLLAYLQTLAAARGAPNASPFPANSGVLAKAVTDSEGNAVFPGVKPGRYGVRATREGYVAPSNGPDSPSPPLAVSSTSVEAVASATDVSVFLNPGAAISGRVQTADGNGVPEAVVALGTIRRFMDGQRETFAAGIATVRTDARGEYRLPLVGPGEYAIRVQSPRIPGMYAYYPGTVDLEKATLLPIEQPRITDEAGRNIVNVDVVLP